MSTKRDGWISRRGQPGAATAIDQVIERQQPGEQVQMIPTDRITDSPYQARRAFDDASIEDLAQGMRETGFQGVLVTRPHSDPVQRRQGVVQLVYGHRRRVAWQTVCAERGEPCVLPIVVREISDERMLTIGAQENLQRRGDGQRKSRRVRRYARHCRGQIHTRDRRASQLRALHVGP